MKTVVYEEFIFYKIIDEIYKAKAYRKADIDKAIETSDTNHLKYITRSDINNGCSLIVNNKEFDKIEKGNAIIVGDTTSTIFYQEDDFICGDHIVVIRASWMNKKRALYIISLLQKERFKYSYGRAYNIDKINKTKILLPVFDGSIDWNYIDNFIDKIQIEVDAKVEKIISVSQNDKNTISVIANKVNANNFENWVAEKSGKIIDMNVNEWKEFYVVRNDNHKGLLELESCKCGNATNLLDGDDVYYRGAKKTRNGVMRRVQNDSSLITSGNCILFVCDGDGSCGYTNYVKDDFIGSTTTSVGKDININVYTGLFLVTILDKEKFKYSHGRKYRVNLEKTKILLPVKHVNNAPLVNNNSIYSTDGFEPDWEYMENYIKSLPFSDKI